MEPWWANFLSQVGVGLFVAIATSIVTVHLSLRRFYSEKWWERKAEAYTAVIAALHHSKDYCDKKLVLEYEHAEVDRTRESALEEQWAKAHSELELRIGIGSFILSAEAMEELHRMERKLADADDPNGNLAEQAEASSAALGECLDRMKVIGRKDLKVDPWLPSAALSKLLRRSPNT